MSRLEFDPEAKEFARNCPKTWQVISGRRYLVPNYRQVDYANQVGLINEYVQNLADYCSGVMDKSETAIQDAHFSNLALALGHNRPTYFLERELGQALMRTVLPEPLDSEMLKWKFPQMRIMLPRDLVLVHFEGRTLSLHYLDIARFDQGKRISFPNELVKELEIDPRISTNRSNGNKGPLAKEGFTYSQSGGIAIASQQTHPDFPLQSLSPCVLRAWPRIDIAKLNGSICLDLTAKAWETMDSRVEHLALNILLFLSSSPEDPKPLEMVRPARFEGKRFVSGLYQAKFVGDSQRKRVKIEPQITATKASKTGSSSAHAAHWVAGFWRQQAHGPNSSLRKLVWIQPYFAQGQKSESTTSP